MITKQRKIILIFVFLFMLMSTLVIGVSAAETGSDTQQEQGFWSIVLGFLSSTSVTIGIIGMAAWAIFKSGSKIFKEGIYFKTELVSKKEMKEFEDSIRQDMRGYRVELQKVIIDACMREIHSQLKDVDEIKKNSQKMIEIRVALEERLKHLDERTEEARSYTGAVKGLIERVRKLESTDNNEKRRHE